MKVLDALAPEKRARHLERFAFQLEEVEQDNSERHEEEQQRRPPSDWNVVAQVKAVLQPGVDRTLATQQVQDEEKDAGNGEQKQDDQRDREPGASQAGSKSGRSGSHCLPRS